MMIWEALYSKTSYRQRECLTAGIYCHHSLVECIFGFIYTHVQLSPHLNNETGKYL